MHANSVRLAREVAQLFDYAMIVYSEINTTTRFDKRDIVTRTLLQ